MKRRRSPCWSFSAGSPPYVVRVYERTPGGVLYLALPESGRRLPDPAREAGRPAYVRGSLAGRMGRELGITDPRDQGAAEAAVLRVAAALRGGTGALDGRLTLGTLIDAYLARHVAGMTPASAKWVRQHLAIWRTYLGEHFRLPDLGLAEWDAFKRARLTGAIDGQGRSVDAGIRHPVSPGTVNLGLDALRMACNWALITREDGRPLLERSPVARLPYCDTPNVQRAVWTHDRYLAALTAAEGIRMQVEWRGRREWVPSPLPEIMAIVEETGRRITAVCQLRLGDVQLGAGTDGLLRWRRETDKGRKEWATPLSPELRQRLVRYLRRHPAALDATAPLFPAPRDLTRGPSRETVVRYLRQALTAADLPRLPAESFHGLRRKWASERKHLPDVDVAAAGGWRSIATMKRYQQTDEAAVREVLANPVRRRESGAR